LVGRGPFVASTEESGHRRRRAVGEEVEDEERGGEDRAGDGEPPELGRAQVPDDRGVDEDVERFGRQGAERGDGEPQDLPVVPPGGRLSGGQIGETTDVMRTYRFYGFTSSGAGEMAAALNEDGMRARVREPGDTPLQGWVVEADGEDRSEGLLEMLAQFFGGAYEGEDLSGA
jgi:hypothetical protein